MPKSERELVLARIARIVALIEALEKTCGDSAANREAFLALKQEIARTDESLRVVTPTLDLADPDPH